MKTNVRKYMLMVLPHLIVLLGIIFIVTLTLGNRQRSLSNATYTRFEVCTLNIPATERTQARIDRCWQLAQQSTTINVDHFDQ